MNQPSHDQVLATVDATWPTARMVNHGPWIIRQGLGGGQRVSAATPAALVSDADIPVAETAMRDLGQHPLFMITGQDAALDALLHSRGYAIVDPVSALAIPIDDMVQELPQVTVFPSWPPLSTQREIWLEDDVGDARIAVMERATCPKITHLGRTNDRPAGTAYTGVHQDIAMLHSLVVTQTQRRSGMGVKLMIAAANWAKEQGARWLTVLVVDANEAANAFYQHLGMRDIGVKYHYRKAPTAAA